MAGDMCPVLVGAGRELHPQNALGERLSSRGGMKTFFFFLNPKKKRKAQLCVVMDAKFVADSTRWPQSQK